MLKLRHERRGVDDVDKDELMAGRVVEVEDLQEVSGMEVWGGDGGEEEDDGRADARQGGSFVLTSDENARTFLTSQREQKACLPLPLLRRRLLHGLLTRPEDVDSSLVSTFSFHRIPQP